MVKDKFKMKMLAWKIECRAIENAVEAHPDPRLVSWCAEYAVLRDAVERCAYGNPNDVIEVNSGEYRADALVSGLGLKDFVIRRWCARWN
jgi:hypothetical protein